MADIDRAYQSADCPLSGCGEQLYEPATLADIERQIELHKRAIRDLCEVGIRLDEAARMPGNWAMGWLLKQGYRTDTDARKLIVQVIQEREAEQTGTVTRPSSSEGGEGRG